MGTVIVDIRPAVLDHSAIELADVDSPDAGKTSRYEVVLAKAARQVEVPQKMAHR